MGGGGRVSSRAKSRAVKPFSLTLPAQLNATQHSHAPDDDDDAEWIAYHYYALPLRYLVVAVDPQSRTSPTQVFDNWRRLLPDLTIVEWTDGNFTNKNLLNQPHHDAKKRTANHRARQSIFIHQCTRHLRDQNRTWTAYHDVDEYMLVNGDLIANADEISRQPGYILKMVKHFRSSNASTDTTSGDQKEPEFWRQHMRKSHCITFARASIVRTVLAYAAREAASVRTQSEDNVKTFGPFVFSSFLHISHNKFLTRFPAYVLPPLPLYRCRCFD